jgi:hypothetical protein
MAFFGHGLQRPSSLIGVGLNNAFFVAASINTYFGLSPVINIQEIFVEFQRKALLVIVKNKFRIIVKGKQRLVQGCIYSVQYFLFRISAVQVI